MGGIFLKLRTWWETADRTQRVVTIFGSAFLAILLGGTFFFASKPKMELAYGGLDPAEQGRVVQAIQKLGVPVEQDAQGNVKVPSDKVVMVRSSLAASDEAPKGEGIGIKDLNGGVMESNDVQNEKIRAYKESSIARSLEAIDGVASARVILNTGSDKGFMDADDPATASVTITEENGASLFGAPAKAMAQLVANSVTGLDIKNVTIVNQDGIALYDGAEQDSAGSSASNKISAQNTEARRIKRELAALLSRFGAGNIDLSVRVEMDFDKTNQREVKVKMHEGMSTNSQWKRERMGADGNPSTDRITLNAPVISETPTEGSKAKGYDGVQVQTTTPYDTTTINTEKATGTITSASITVVVNEGADPAINPDVVDQIIRGWCGPAKLDAKGGWNVSVTAAPFDTKPQTEAKKAVADAAGQARMQQIFSLLPVGALVVVALMVIKSIRKVATSSDVVVTALPGGQLVHGTRAFGGGSALALPAGDDYYEEDDGGGVAVLKKKKKKLSAEEEEEDEDDPVRVGRISQRVNVELEQIKKMANDKPEAIAMLIKSWMVEERR